MIEPRRIQNVKDVQAMQALLMDGRKADNGTYYIHAGDLSWWLYYPPLEGAYWDDIYLWDDLEKPGRLLGWCLIAPDWSTLDVYTQPELRGSRLAMDMYLWAEDQAVRVARLNGKPSVSMIWVRHADGLLCSYFEERNFLRKRGNVYLSRSLEVDLAAPEVPQGFSVRSCKGEPEVVARAKAQYGAFASTVPFERYVARFTGFMRSPAYRPDLDIVAVAPDGRVAAFCILWLDPLNKNGHFEPVGTHPDFHRKGLGRAVMLEGMHRLQSAGMLSADVVTGEDNEAAIKLYESVGFQVTDHLGTYVKEV